MAATQSITQYTSFASIEESDHGDVRDSMDSGMTEDTFLPDGMGVKEALARCEDPTLGWSLQFWITIADPITQHVFYACPATGQTSWVPPQGVFIVPRQAEGEWWELADTSRNNRSYFYNTLTRQTQWTRPVENQFVIPLGLIQNTASPARGARRDRLQSATSADHLRPNNPSSPLARNESRGRHQSDPPNPSRLAQPLRTPQIFTNGPKLGIPISRSQPFSPLTPHLEQSSPRTPKGSTPITPDNPATPRNIHTLSVVGEGDISESGNEADQSVGSDSERTVGKLGPGGVVNGQNGKMGSGRRFFGMLGRSGKSWTSPNLSEVSLGKRQVPPNLPWTNQRNGSSVSIGLPSPLSRRNPHDPNLIPLSQGSARSPIHVGNPDLRSKRLSTGLHPLLPTAILTGINNFRATDFASIYFATRRSGLLRQKQPLDKVLEWQKQPITAPLLNSSKGSAAKEAIMCFKVIQRAMGERDRPVDGAKVHVRSTRMPEVNEQSPVNSPGRGWIYKKEEGGIPIGQSVKAVMLEEIQWMIQACLRSPELKDEVYCQVVKQGTKNPDQEAVVLGFQLFSVLANAFAPGKNFVPFTKSFLEGHLDSTHAGIAKIARYALTKMTLTSTRHVRGRALTPGEIEHASDAAFYPSVYGESLTKIMRDQSASHPQDKIPIILPFLANAILQLNGQEAEGIFRIPGDGDVVSELKSRMDRGHYHFAGIDDPHVAASLFKLWLRELEEPLIPTDLYNKALESASTDHPERAITFVSRLPMYNRRVLLFVVAFFKLFCGEEVVANTKMTPSNLALVLAPNILRTTSDSLSVVYTNSTFESRFVWLLLQHLNVEEVDEGYAPKVELSLIA